MRYRVSSLVALLSLVLLVYFSIARSTTDQSNKTAMPTTTVTQSTDVEDQVVAVKATIPYWDEINGFNSLQQNVQKITYLSLYRYFLTADQTIQRYKDATENNTVQDYARDHNVKVLAVITNLPEDKKTTWDAKRVAHMLETDKTRKHHIDDIVALVTAHSFDGVSIDYEQVGADQRDKFSAFIAELSAALHARGKFVSVALHPKTGENKPFEDNGSRAQDWPALAQSADQLVIMAYGEHWDDSDPGPIASVQWVKSIISYAQALKMPPNKLLLGIGLYGYAWPPIPHKGDQPKATDLTFSDIEQLLKTDNPTLLWDDKAKAPHFSYQKADKKYTVWFENRKSVQEKIALARQAHFAGVSLWRLGEEDPAVWDNFKSRP